MSWNRRAAWVLGVGASACVHLGLALLLWRLPEPAADRAPAASRVRVVLSDTPGGDPSASAVGTRPRGATPLKPGGPDHAANVDTDRAGRGGDREGATQPLRLMHRGSDVTLQDAPLNNVEAAQTQRIRTGDDRASWETERRATPNPSDDPFLASGSGPHRERRPVARTDAREGARRAPEASVQGERATENGGAHAVEPTPKTPGADDPEPPAEADVTTAKTADARYAEAPKASGDKASAGHRKRSAGARKESPGVGIQDGAGERAAKAGRVAHGRPPLDHGPAATPAREQGRVRDNRNSELLAARMVESFVEASRRGGPEPGAGNGGQGSGGAPGSGGTHGNGGDARPHGPGPGRYPSLNTDSERYERWYLEQRKQVEDALHFPREHQLAMNQGTTVYRLIVRRDGTLATRPKLLRSSRHDDLDTAALEAIRHTAPFSPLPSSLAPSHDRIRITLAVRFSNPMIH